jgi:hypothetical protein
VREIVEQSWIDESWEGSNVEGEANNPNVGPTFFLWTRARGDVDHFTHMLEVVNDCCMILK